MSIEVPFDPLNPLAVLPRLAFELVSLLGWTGSAAHELQLTGGALGWFLVLKDELLRREANLPETTDDPLRAARQCVETAGTDVDVQQLVLDFLALLLRRGQFREDVAGVARQLAPLLCDPAKIDRLGGLMYAAGDERAAANLVVRAALRSGADSDLVERAASMAFRVGDDEGVAAVVAAARAADSVTPNMIAQLAASYDRVGDLNRRHELVEELLGLEDLAVPVARLVVSFLLEEDQPAIARTVVEAALKKAPDQAMLHYELGRACLLLDDAPRAGLALRRAIELGMPEHLQGQANRLLRLSIVPGLWNGTHLVEKAITSGDLGAALGAVRALVRRVGPVAEAWLMFGIVQHKLGKLRRAERLLCRAVSYHEDCAAAMWPRAGRGRALAQGARIVAQGYVDVAAPRPGDGPRRLPRSRGAARQRSGKARCRSAVGASRAARNSGGLVVKGFAAQSRSCPVSKLPSLEVAQLRSSPVAK